MKAGILGRFFDRQMNAPHFPRPFGVFYTEERQCYEDALNEQVETAIKQKGAGDLNKLLTGREIWEIQ